MEQKDRERMLLKMQQDCDASLKWIEEALRVRHTEEMRNLRAQLGSARDAVGSLLQSFSDDPTRNLDGVMHCVLWFMISHAGGMEEVKRGRRQMKMPPNTNRIRRSQRRI